MCRLHCAINQKIPSWTGFHILIRNEVIISKSKIAYLETIDSPATELSTVFEILCRALAIKDKLDLSSIVVTFDQAIYAKAIDIKQKEPDKFKSIVLLLGGFHTLMMALGIVGKRYDDAGLRDAGN
eukprot:Seg7404.3 transcript_id=Seg7404.3/GoldUCD/mRNA.D3Y31 product="hypothetical protein" protein_id=Seg7404.3/GoldUCD/D3Y31